MIGNINIMKYIILILLVFCQISCNSFCYFWYNDVKIGNNISYIDYSQKNKVILYCTSSPCCNAGIELVPNKILRYKVNDDWIIAESTNGGYYIVEKKFTKKSNVNIDSIREYVYGGYSLEEFEKVAKQKRISLNW